TPQRRRTARRPTSCARRSPSWQVIDRISKRLVAWRTPKSVPTNSPSQKAAGEILPPGQARPGVPSARTDGLRARGLGHDVTADHPAQKGPPHVSQKKVEACGDRLSRPRLVDRPVQLPP